MEGKPEGVKRGWRWLAWIGVPFLLAGIALSGLLWWPERDSFAFLGGRWPVAGGVMPPMQVDSFVAPGYESPASSFRVYSWRQNPEDVVKSADQEIKAKGFRRAARPMTAGDVLWVRSDGMSVYVCPGLSRTAKEAMQGTTREVERAVTVIVDQPLPESWLTHVKIAFARSDY